MRDVTNGKNSYRLLKPEVVDGVKVDPGRNMGGKRQHERLGWTDGLWG